MARFDDLITTVETYQALAAENYDRVRRLAEDLREGMCAYMNSSDGVCVHLVPPMGAFKPKPYTDEAFSVPPRGFRPLGPIAFGLAVRVSNGTDWLRVTMECQKVGDRFTVNIMDGAKYTFSLPLADNDTEPFYEHIYLHVHDWFQSRIERYTEGDYGQRDIGFDFAEDDEGVSA
ncbi:MAG: hypothetical protein AAGK23_08885 [Pseudomonadota bacterium]